MNVLSELNVHCLQEELQITRVHKVDCLALGFGEGYIDDWIITTPCMDWYLFLLSIYHHGDVNGSSLVVQGMGTHRDILVPDVELFQALFHIREVAAKEVQHVVHTHIVRFRDASKVDSIHMPHFNQMRIS